jgi:dihydrofolate synthase / folylpolyglutamate synthase
VSTVESSFNSTEEIEKWLNSIPMFSSSGRSAANFNLNRMVLLLKLMGNPQQSFRSIHVGGTNGKGTVCRMLASVFQSAGYKTAIYTSPHLNSVWERFKINAKEVNPEDLIPFFQNYGSYLEKHSFTYFEITTAIAFWYFSKEKVDIAIIEVGLGGRLDATNVIEPLLSVITSVSLDHTDILGNSLESVAFEKSGIIKKKRPVVIGELPEECEKIIRQAAAEKGAELLKYSEISSGYEDGNILLKTHSDSELIIPYIGKKIDAQNAALVYLVIDYLTDVLPVEEKQIIEGLTTCHQKFPSTASFEKLHPKLNWFFDGAHNSEAAKHLVNHLKSVALPEEWTVVLTFMRDKLTEEMASIWRDFNNIYLYEMTSERAATIDEMKHFFPKAKQISSLKKVKSNQFKTELVIFSGSFYFYNEVSKWLGATSAAQ